VRITEPGILESFACAISAIVFHQTILVGSNILLLVYINYPVGKILAMLTGNLIKFVNCLFLSFCFTYCIKKLINKKKEQIIQIKIYKKILVSSLLSSC